MQRYPSQQVDVKCLEKELKFNCGRTVRNRFLKAGMSEQLGRWTLDLKKRGIPTQRAINAYERWGNGSFGIVVTGNIPVCSNHLQLAGNIAVSKENDSEELRTQLKKCAKVLKADGAIALMQLAHAGALTPAAINPTPFAPSDVQAQGKVPFGKFGKPVSLSEEQIETEVIDRFVFAARVALESGFDGVEIYAAHGFLLSQFLSPRTNRRLDRYGGTPENRIRIILQIYDRIRKEVPSDFVVGIKMNSVEFQEDGLNTTDAQTMMRLIEERGFDFVELSGGTVERPAFQHERESTRLREAYFLEFTDKLRSVFKNTKMFVTGGFRTAAGMVKAVEGGSTDGVGLARPAAAEPDLPKKILSGEVLGAIQNNFPADDFSVNSVAAVAQIALMGKRTLQELDGRVMGDVPDFSRPEEAENFLKALNAFGDELMKLIEANLPVDIILEYEPLFIY